MDDGIAHAREVVRRVHEVMVVKLTTLYPELQDDVGDVEPVWEQRYGPAGMHALKVERKTPGPVSAHGMIEKFRRVGDRWGSNISGARFDAVMQAAFPTGGTGGNYRGTEGFRDYAEAARVLKEAGEI